MNKLKQPVWYAVDFYGRGRQIEGKIKNWGMWGGNWNTFTEPEWHVFEMYKCYEFAVKVVEQ